MSEEKKLKFEIKDSELEFGIDSNQDGESSVKGKLVFSEALEEAIKRGEPVEGAKVIDFRFELTKLRLSIDTDKDGEKLFEFELDLGEAADEVKDLFKKKENS